MAKYFIPPVADPGPKIELAGDLAHHLIKVLRVQTGEELTLCDQARDYRVAVEAIQAKTLSCRLLESRPAAGEPELELWLLQAIAKGEKMDLIIQKGVELGVSHFVPLITANSVVKIGAKGAEKQARWQKVAAAGAEQSGRGKIPLVHPVQSLKDFLAQRPEGTLVFCWEQAREGHLKEVLKAWRSGPILVLIGPEGGFSPEEAEAVVAQGGIPVSLGPRILRTETAGIAVLGAISYELGDWGCNP